MSNDKFEDVIKFRCPSDLRPRLKAIAKYKGTKYQHEARVGVTRFIQTEESQIKEAKKSAKS